MLRFSVIIITHDREKELSICLQSLRSDFENWEILILENGKKLSQDIVDLAFSVNKNTRILFSEKKMLPGKARNHLISHADGEWLFFIDDDAYVSSDYWRHLSSYLSSTEIDIFGGPDSLALGKEESFPTSLSLTLSSPFCTGPTYSRHQSVGKDYQLADENRLSSCNLWIRRSLFKTGHLFPENFVRAEEIHLLKRFRLDGISLFYMPKLKVHHFRRKHLMELFRPTFYAGYFRAHSERCLSGKKSTLFWFPALFVLMHLTYFLDPFLFYYFVQLYLALISFVSLQLALKQKNIFLFFNILLLHYVIVTVYGVGYLMEKLSFGKMASGNSSQQSDF